MNAINENGYIDIEALTDYAFDMCKKMANIELSIDDKDSLKKLDEVIKQIKGLKAKKLVDEDIAKNISVPFGVFAGEVMLKDRLEKEGFKWTVAGNNDDNGNTAEGTLVLIDKAGVNTVDPVSMVYKNLMEDDSATSLFEFYNAFVIMLSML